VTTHPVAGHAADPAAGPVTHQVAAAVRERRPLLRIRGLSVDYGFGADAVHAVDGVDLDIARGEVVGLAGESGSGKSTLAYAVTRLLREPGVIVGGAVSFYDWPAGGSVGNGSAEPREIDLLSGDRRAIDRVRWSKIAVVFQSALHALNPVLRVGTLIDDVLKAHAREMSARRRRERARELLDMVGISPGRLTSFPHELSGGMRQRVMIALALALRPQLLIMDEPTTALDVVIQREILTELMDLRTRLGFSVLFITHDLSLLIEIADTIAVMYAGRLVEKAPAKALFHAPRHPYTYGLTNSFPSLHGPRRVMTGIEGSPPDLRRVPAGCPFHPRCGWAMPVCAERQPPDLLLQEACGDRRVLCHLQDAGQAVPPELAAAVPAGPAWAGITASPEGGATG
jgi:peptide/nickel transport system ATP-binding protein